MSTYEFEYIKTGSGEIPKTDRVILRTGEEFEFEDGNVIAHNITDLIELFEKVAAKWWGTYENRNSIVNIQMLTR